MMLNKIIDHYVVSDQITEEDIDKLKEAGFKTIFCKNHAAAPPFFILPIDSQKQLENPCEKHIK